MNNKTSITVKSKYQEKIREGKIDMLRTAFLDAISMIIRKHDFINDIIIDSKYNIQLQREDGHYIYKSMLSNGEKQIYAISMLLALAQVSGKPLPFIIDTPLARLDSDHRENIVGTWYYSTEAKSRVLYRSKGITKFTCGFRVRSELGILCRWE